ncbi:MAG TPA: hypothetical protein VMH86_09335 [Rhizomicrobium sp.]|nr:hypothetical protein [Rhizomicrobium sp.]
MTAPAHDDWLATSGENDWSVAANWSLGEPDATRNVYFQAHTAYQADVTTAVTAHDLVFKAHAGTLFESAAGSMTLRSAQFDAGKAILNAANSIASVTVEASEVDFSVNGALGNGGVSVVDGLLEATGDVTVKNALVLDGGILAVDGGHTLTLQGGLGFEGPTLILGSSGGANGAMVIGSRTFDGSDYELRLYSDLSSGTGLRSAGFTALLNGAAGVNLQATLDLTNAGANAITLHNLGGAGLIASSNGHTGLTIDHGVTSAGFALNSAVTIEGGVTFDSGALGNVSFLMASGSQHLTLANASGGRAFVSAAPDSEAVVHLGTAGSVTAHFIGFENGNITIDTGYSTDAVASWTDETGQVKLTIRAHAGAAAYNIFFSGLGDHTGFELGSDGHGHLQITYPGAPAESAASHEAAVAQAAAEASFVHLPPDIF